ncbi:FAD-dependent monooxygenase [Saccharopolyspora spinosporotrichia]
MNIAVVGAGIAGLATAAALERAGLRCTVYERSQRLAAVGAGIQISPNASRLLHRVGLAERLESVAVRPEALELRRWDDGRLLGRTVLGDRCEELFGAPYYTLHRADLHSALLETVRSDVRLGYTCEGVEELERHALLRFSEKRTETADVVVGADGIKSTVRNALLTDRPRFSGQVVYRGLVPTEAVLDPHDSVPKVTVWLGPAQHCVFYPVSGGRLVNFVATVPSEDPWQEESWMATGRVEDLRRAYTCWHRQVRQLFAEANAVTRWALHDRDLYPTWSTARLAVVGDAAHPMLPFIAQGSNQAVEDAFALAASLGSCGGQIDAALERYQVVRVPRVAKIHRESRSSTSNFHLDDGPAQQDRDVTLRDVHELHNRSWLFGHDVESSFES